MLQFIYNRTCEKYWNDILIPILFQDKIPVMTKIYRDLQLFSQRSQNRKSSTNGETEEVRFTTYVVN